MEENKSELAIERDHWFLSQEGKRCSDFSTLKEGPYLKNRLEAAFLAGAIANEKAKQEITNKLLTSKISENNKLNPNAELWVKALESDNFKQITLRLGSKERGFCCLGVACYIFEEHTGVNLPKDKYGNYTGGSLTRDFSKVREWLGIKGHRGSFKADSGFTEYLTSLNDNEELSFKEIAAVIKSKPEGLFKEEVNTYE